MMRPYIQLPSVEYQESYLQAQEEFIADGTQQQDQPLATSEGFSDFVQTILDQSEGKGLPEGYIPQSVFWLIDEGEFIGRVSIRHGLTEKLKQLGGHIGYGIRPSFRGQGYGTKILELALPKAKELGITEVLITCDVTNIGSKKIIEANGGILENEVPNPETGVNKLRYWIHV